MQWRVSIFSDAPKFRHLAPEDWNKKRKHLLYISTSFFAAPRAGLEPATLRLTVACSTIELPRNAYQQKSYFH
jgi:hypothetical protein